MPPTTLPDIRQIDSFEFISTLERVRSRKAALPGDSRPLDENEIARLRAQGNEARNWSAITVAGDFSPEFVRNNRFFGACRLGFFDGSPVDTGASIALPAGIYDSIITDSMIGDGCSVWNVKGCGNYFIDNGAILYNIGTMA